MKRWKKITASIIAATVIFSGGGLNLFGGMTEVRADNCGGLLEEDVYQPDPDEVIQDPILHWAVRSAMNAVKSGVKLTAEMVSDPSVQTISYELCNHPEDFEGWKMPYYIENLEGLQYATSARMIDIGYTANIEGKKIESLEPLAGLTQLEILYLKQDGIDNISRLERLVNLQELNLSGNYGIADIASIKDMKKLTNLDISMNRVSDLTPVEGLVNLEWLNAGRNQISVLPDMSGLEKLRALDLSENQLTDVTALAKLTNLEELNLSGNSGITDVTALAVLTNLDKDSTYLPTEKMKEDLFAAIDVNRMFLKFNISRMTEADLANVTAALEAYESLTEDQKTYIDDKMVGAARNNQSKVEKGEEPEYYEEYDKGGEPVPVLDRIVIHAVDKYGKPMKDISFVRKDDFGATTTKATNEQGIVEFVHSSFDKYGVFEVRPEGDAYVAAPEKITYSVNGEQETDTVNGKPATGFEDLRMTLIPVEEYVDKSDLKAAIQESEGIPEEDSYKYTVDTWNSYETALEKAREVLDDVEAEEDAVKEAADELRKAYEGLKKAEILTKLKITVKDENGNPFTRDFKLQIRNPKDYDEAWNAYSDPTTSVAYLDASPAWSEGKVWEILACYEEPYEFESFKVTIGIQDGQRYFKQVDGEEINVDYETEIILTPAEKETAFIPPDSAVLKGYIEQAETHEEADYTPGTWKTFEQALTEAKEAAQNGKTQEVYNQAAANLLKAEKDLRKNAEKYSLKEAIDEYYTENVYTPATWATYQKALAEAEKVYEDVEATQEAVDRALTALKQAQDRLELRADKSKLSAAIQRADRLVKEDYVDGWEELQEVLAKAKEVNADADATQTEVNQQTEALENAIDALKEAPVEMLETCSDTVFRAVVQDEEGNRLSGISFTISRKGSDETDTITSKENGILEYYLASLDWGNETTIRLADGQGYTTTDSHSFTVTGISTFPSFDTIDDQPYQEGTKLTYTLKKEGSAPSGDPVLSDETTFRAKVVDEAGNPVSGVTFNLVSNLGLPDDSYKVETDEQGILEYTLLEWIDWDLKFTVTLAEAQEAPGGGTWKSDDTCEFTTDGNGTTQPAKITEINGKPLAEAGEIVFHLSKEGGGTQPTVDKSGLQAKIQEAEKISGEEYTESSFEALQQAIEEAKTVYEDDQATKEQVEEQISKLEKAIEDLQDKPQQPGEDKEELKGWLQSAATYEEAEYTPETYQVLKKAVEEGQKVLENPDADAEAIKNACEAIETAIAQLKKADLPVYCEKNYIRIKVVDENGERVENGIPFSIDRDGSIYNATTYDGQIDYMLSTADSSTKTVTVYLKDGSVIRDGKEYVAEPEKFEFTLK